MELLKSVDIISAVKELIKSKYDYAVYLEDSKENCDSPCFFLALNIFRRRAGKHKFFCDGNLYITYFAKKGTTDAIEFYHIKDTIQEILHEGIKVQDRYIKIKSQSAETDGEDADIIYFDFQFEYYDVFKDSDTEAEYLIEHVYQNLNGGK